MAVKEVLSSWRRSPIDSSMSDGKGRGLTRHEFDAVIRRASELAAADSDGGELPVSEAELFRIAREVGLNERHVRTALSEVRAGVDSAHFVDRVFGAAMVHASRVVPGGADELGSALDEFFVATQLLQRVRRGNGILQYRPALDWASQLARAASFTSRKYYVASSKSVEVRLEPVEDGRTLVELVVDPGTRKDAVWGAGLGGGAAGVAVGIGAAALLAGGPFVLAIAIGVGGGAMTAATIARAVGVSHKRKLAEVQTEVEGILDRLELGESLEPPPPSWRRWVKRQFHGVARDLSGKDEEPEGR